MTPKQWAIAGAAAAAVAVVIGWQTGALDVNARAEVDAGSPPQPDELATGVTSGWLCGDVPGLPQRHPLHRRHDGHAMRQALVGGGWDWYLNPPAPEGL